MTLISFIVTGGVSVPRGFNEVEKLNISENLIIECRKQWELYGYRKTSVDTLCINTGISKGGFYQFYESKEDLFIKTMSRIQEDLYLEMDKTLNDNPSKQGFCDALKLIYREYDRSPFLYNTTGIDMLSLFNKLDEKQMHNVKMESFIGAKKLLSNDFLKLKISDDLAISVLSTLLFAINGKDKMLSNHFEVFDFLLKNLIDNIFE